jgi:hypothetical protein
MFYAFDRSTGSLGPKRQDVSSAERDADRRRILRAGFSPDVLVVERYDDGTFWTIRDNWKSPAPRSVAVPAGTPEGWGE